jgi:group I intron endonuclease
MNIFKEKKYNFVYLTTNLVNGKQYVGDHSCNNLVEDNYLGSGMLFETKKNQYGKENFKREILEFFPTKQEAFNAQEKYILQYNTLVPNGYNINPTGGIYREGGGLHSEETKIKMSESAKKSFTPQKRAQISEGNRNRIISDKTKNKIRNTLFGREVSKEVCEKISKTLKGKPVKINTVNIKCEYCHKISNLGNYNRWHGDNCKNKVST